MAGWGFGEVVKSNAKGFEPGDLVSAEYGWQEFAALPGRMTLTKRTTRSTSRTHIIGACSASRELTGLFRHAGRLASRTAAPARRCWWSTAAGAVGAIAGQIAETSPGLPRTISTTGGPEKCEWIVKELGFDGAIDYKAGGIYKKLKEVTPNGLDVYFDEVTGGDVLSAALSRMNLFGRVASWAATISQYNTGTLQGGPAGVPGFSRDEAHPAWKAQLS